MFISLVPPLGVITLITIVPTVFLTISLAVVLKTENLALSALAIVAASLELLFLASVFARLYQWHCNRSEELRKGSIPAINLLRFAFILYFISAAVTLATLISMHIQRAALPGETLGASTPSIIVASFVIWGVSSLAQALFLLGVLHESRQAAQQSQSIPIDEERFKSSELQQASYFPPQFPYKESADLPPGSSSGRKRSGSDTINSIRSSITQVVRPMSSKARLVPQKPRHRPQSVDSGTGERDMADEGFDSWDTSTVDLQSRQFVMSAATSTNPSSPIPGRFLETIPASPTGSRSPSPGFPLELEPPPRRTRSRSYSPATSYREVRRRDPSMPIPPMDSEAHIHPLFRSDSPTPPPTATPGTVVTAAPGAGLVISGRLGLNRMRSGSLPTSPSPLGFRQSQSMEDVRIIKTAISRDDDEEDDDRPRPPSPPEREMTPPIPDWILGAGSRTSFSGYTRRKQAAGLGAVGEVRES